MSEAPAAFTQDIRRGRIGHSLSREDAHGKVCGLSDYPGDMDLDGQLWMHLRFSDRAHARVKAINCDAALAMAGVRAVFTAADVPVNEYGLVTKDQPVLCGPGSGIAGADIVRSYMDCVAVVIAEDEATARKAAAKLEIDYEDLPALFDAEAAMADGQPQLHADIPNNILSHYVVRCGDMAAGWQQAEMVIEGEYDTGMQEHAYLQPEAGLSYIDEQGRVTVCVAGQWIHEDLWQICHALDLPEDRVRVVYPAVGGAFGGREDMSIQIVLALAAHRLRQPIKTIWSREESILYHHKRHAFRMRMKWGATRAGQLVAAEATVIADAGAYNYTSSKVLANAAVCATGPYAIPNVHTDAYAVLTNNLPCGAFRGFGSPQALFAAENQLNKLAATLDMDPITLRERNILREGSIHPVGSVMPAGVSLPEVIDECARASYWQKTDDRGWMTRSNPDQDVANGALRRGRGFACGYKNVGFSMGFPEESWATVELDGEAEIEQAIVRLAGAEVGQGAHTVFAQMAAEAIGIPRERIEMRYHDTGETQNSGSASASRLTFMSGNALLGATERALAAWADEERPARATYQYRPPPTTPINPEKGISTPNITYGYVAQAVEVEVDIETGLIRLVQVYSANDVGRALNPNLIEGQIEGGVVQAQGYALMEHLISTQGQIRNPFLSTYLIPTVADIPESVHSIILEYPDPLGPWGARGMAEMPLLPLAPAIVAAIHDATGVWFDQIPLTPDRVVARLREHDIGVL